MPREQIVYAVAIGFVMAGLTIGLIRRSRLNEAYAFFWLVVSVAFVGLLLVSVQFSLALSAAERRDTTLAQPSALLVALARYLEGWSAEPAPTVA